MGFWSSNIRKFANFLVKNQNFRKLGSSELEQSENGGSGERPESLKKGVLTAGHTRIVLTCECPPGLVHNNVYC